MSDLNINHRITIVTAFFDIGRGNIPKNQGYPGYLTRTTKTYFKYFSNLAKLNNEMVIFTSPDLKERILKLRNFLYLAILLLSVTIYEIAGFWSFQVKPNGMLFLTSTRWKL